MTARSKRLINHSHNAYQKLVDNIKEEIEKGTLNARSMLERQIVRTNWRVGRFIVQYLIPTPRPSSANARFVEGLANDLNRPDMYVYNAMKFYRAFPIEPEQGLLTWSHYEILMRIQDDSQRHRYQQIAISQDLGRDVLRGLVLKEKMEAKNAKLFSPAEFFDGSDVLCLSVVRGTLYHYTLREHSTLPLNPGMVLVDLGFNFRREVAVDKDKSYHGGLYVLATKSREKYRVKIANHKTGMKRLYTYKSYVERIVDGDTLILNIDCGFRAWTRQRIRLRGIDTAEIHSQRGKRAKKFVEGELAKANFVIVKVYKEGKYGRFLGDIFHLPKENDKEKVTAQGRFLNQELLNAGLAELWKG